MVTGTIGIEWINKYHGRAKDLKNNDDNARGFFNTLDGVRQFECGDDLAWDQDFEESGLGYPPAGTDQIFADDVDIIFFSGHGDRNGPFFGVAAYDDGQAKPAEMRLGDGQAKWIVLDACLCLASDNWSSWYPVFRGLHAILGFHTICSDRSSRGRRFAEYLNDGWTIRRAWERACEDTEDSNVWWAYMCADQQGTNTIKDHWLGKGYVSPDPTSPNSYGYAYGPC